MNRRDFIFGLACFFSGLAIGEFKNNKKEKKIDNFKIQDAFTIAVVMASHCNLSCKGCATYSPLAKQEFVTLEDFKNDFSKLKVLLKNTDTMNICFYGGEPLLNPELEEIIITAKKLFPNGYKSIATNGILLNTKNDDFWKLLNKLEIVVKITKYPINIDREKYEEKAKKYNVKINYDPVKSNNLFDLQTKQIIDKRYNQEGFAWGKNIIDLSGSQDPNEKIKICPHRNLTTYVRGNLYYCNMHAFINAFIDYFKVDIPITEKDYIKISQITNERQLYHFIQTPKQLCKYCKYCHNTCYGKEPSEWDFSRKEISEWTET